MDCLTDYIGLKGCTSSTPRSGKYVNQLPGIEFQMVDKLADEQQVNYAGVWTDIQTRAQARLHNDVISEFKKRYKIKTLTQSFDISKEIDTSNTTAAAAQYRGYSLEFDPDNELVDSNLQVHYLQSLPLYFTSLNATTIVVYDLDTGLLLSSKAVSAPTSTGWTTINLDLLITSPRIFVGYDATSLDSYDLDISLLRATASNCDSCSDSDCVSDIRGAYATIAAPTTLTYGDSSFGLSGIISTKCSFDGLICNNLETFTTPYWYLLGAELSKERLYSSRLNEFTIFDRNKAKELWQNFEIMYMGGTLEGIVHEGALVQAIDGIYLDENDCCLECSNKIRFMEGAL